MASGTLRVREEMFSLGQAKGNSVFWGALVGLVFGLCMASSPVMVQAGELSRRSGESPIHPVYAEPALALDAGTQRRMGMPLSYLPSPLKLPSVKATPVLTETDTLPATFDLRTVDGVTPVKGSGIMRFLLGLCRLWFPGVFSQIPELCPQDLEFFRGRHEPVSRVSMCWNARVATSTWLRPIWPGGAGR